MIDHHVAHQIMFPRKRFHIAPIAEGRLNLAVVDRREASIAAGRKERQNVDAAHRACELFVKRNPKL
ncbi:hypothetical protein SDC9_155045 [bioreactor metagenome]|uniref:Uncharacterized protein n=1 Tax=bioreactor metagenome TaxID=1076179 RepID=A0A645F5E4_9ZZZZ